jgi:hypothetical protein
MIQRAFKLQSQIGLYYFNNKRKSPPIKDDDGLIKSQILTDDDWVILTHLLKGLELFEHSTLRLQGAAKSAVFGSL